ncbi:hypothetical protein SAMN02927937_02753 [Paenimyroides aquimaris]|uniref:Uncharacterized protein n=1 Tax=Paenimyroides marinum TaxID=1159016 RepID=A0A1H6MJ33_9FLAO|nr:hypothetical protein SAMN02927937_02753 [Paenimyroides aquimaris]
MYLIKVNIYTTCYFNKKGPLFKKTKMQYVERTHIMWYLSRAIKTLN